MDKQYTGILLQALLPEYESILSAHTKRQNLGLADSPRMTAIYADNLSRRNITSPGLKWLCALWVETLAAPGAPTA